MRKNSYKFALGTLLLCMMVQHSFAAYDTDGLEGYWKLDEGSGTSTADSSGHNRTGTLVNTPTWTVPSSPTISFTNPYDLSFDSGSSEYVSIGSSPTSGNFPFSYSLWINTSDSTDAYRTIFSEGNTGDATPSFHIQITEDDDVGCTTDDSIKVFMNDDAGTNVSICSTTNYADGAWHHIALVSSASNNHELFIDGASIDTDTTNLGSTTFDAAAIGALRQTSYSQYFNGQIDDVRVYSRALSDAEVAKLAAGSHTTAIWDGSSNTDFETAANWNINAIPDPFTNIIIADGLGGPQLSKPASGAALTIEATGFTGSHVDLHGFDFEFVDSGTLKGGGTLRLLGSETTAVVNHGTASTGAILYYGTGSYTGLATGDSYYDLIINDGLVGYWNFDLQVGGYVNDVSGFDHIGTRGTSPATPTFVTTTAPTAYYNLYALDFDGSDDVVTVHSNDKISNIFKEGGTIASWIYLEDWGEGNLGRIVDKSNSTNAANGFSFLVSDSGDELRFSRGFSTSRGRWDAPDSSLSLNTWHHVAVTYDENSSSNDPRLFIDGVSVTVTESTSPSGTATTDTSLALNIGNYSDGSRTFDGLIDDVRLYDRILQDHEIAALAAGHMPATASGTFTLDANLDVNHDMVLAAGDVDVSGSYRQINVGGSWFNYGGQFSHRDGQTTVLDASSGTEYIQSGGQAFFNLNPSAGATWQLHDVLDIDGTLSQTAGTIDVSTDNHSIHASQLSLSGDITERSGLVVLNGSSNTTATITPTLNELQIEDSTEDGLVGYWKLDECQGDTTVDSSGTGNDGTLYGPPFWTGSSLPTAIKFDNICALNFDAEDRDVEISDDNTLDLGDEFTLAGWAMFDDFDETYMFLIAKDGATNADDSYTLGVRLQKLYVAINDGSWAEYSADTTLSANTWYHMAGVRNADDTLDLYLNGVLDGTFSSVKSPKNVATPVTLGQRDAAALEMDGTIDDLRIYNRSLSPIEIRNLANGRYAEGTISTATFTLGGDIDLDSMTILSGKVSAGSRTIDVSGDWNNYAGSGSFIEGTSTVDLDGSSSQNVRGTTEFYNLEASTASAQTILFGSGTTQFITNALTLTGTAGKLLTLGPLTAAIEWLIDLSSGASQTLNFLDVSYSDASNGEELEACSDSTNSGNNTNWDFDCAAAGTASTGGGWRSNKQAIAKSGSSGDGYIAQSDTESPSLAAVGIADDVTEKTAVGVGGILDPSMRTYSTEDPSRRVREVFEALVQRFQKGIVEFRTAQNEAAETLKGSALEDTERRMQRADRKVADRFSDILTASAIGERRGLLVATVKSEQVVFADVPIDSWFTPFVSSVISEEIATGYEDEDGNPTGEFGVTNPVTLAESLKMSLQAASIEMDAGTPRNSSAEGTWASPFVAKAEAMGLDVFAPDRNVHEPATRAEVIHTILEVLGLPIAPSGDSPFVDLPDYHKYASSIATANFYGIMTGDTDGQGNPLGTVRPDDTINRAEVAKMIALIKDLFE